MRKRLWFGWLCVGLNLFMACGVWAETKALPKVAESEKKKPKRFSVPQSAADFSLPRSIMEVPSSVTDSPAPELAPIQIKDKNKVTIDNVMFGFLLRENKPLKDEELKRKARMAVADLWFGKSCSNCWLDRFNLLHVEGTPLRVVFVQMENGKRKDFSLQDEPAIEKQFFDQVRAILQTPGRRSLAKFEQQNLFFGLTKTGRGIANNDEELAAQTKFYALLEGKDVPEWEVGEDGSIKTDANERLTVNYFYIEPVGDRAEVVALREPAKSLWRVKSEQHLRQIVVVERAIEIKRQAEVAQIGEILGSIEKTLASGAKRDDREARKQQLEEASRLLLGLNTSMERSAKEEEKKGFESRSTEAQRRISEQMEALLYPITLKIAGNCSLYRLNQTKRLEWRLEYTSKEPQDNVLEAPPKWLTCEGDLLFLSVGTQWHVFDRGKIVLSKTADTEFINAVNFSKVATGSVISVAYSNRQNLVQEIHMSDKLVRNRVLLGKGLDEKFPTYLDGSGDVTVAALGKFGGVDLGKIIPSKNGFSFSAKSGRNPERGKNQYFVTVGKVIELPEAFIGKNIKELTWDDARESYRANFEEEDAYFYEMAPPAFEVSKLLKVSAECEAHYGFKVQDSGSITVEFKDSDAMEGLEIIGLRSVACSAKSLLFLSADAKVLHGIVESVNFQKENPELNLPTLFVVSQKNELSAMRPPKDFAFSGIEVSQDRTEKVVTMKGPISISYHFDEAGDVVAPSSIGNPNEAVGLWKWPDGTAILWEKGSWIATFKKATSIDMKGDVASVVASGTKLREAVIPTPDNALLSFEKGKLVGSFTAPLEAEGEVIEKTSLLQVGEEWFHQIWLKNNTDYTLVVSLDGKRVEPRKYVVPQASGMGR